MPVRDGHMMRLLIGLVTLLAASCYSSPLEDHANQIAPLIDPGKLATLKGRAANPRVRKYVYWLGMAEQAKLSPREVATEAVRIAGYKGEAAALTIAAMVRNLDIATKLGCLDESGLSEMRKGSSPTVQCGPYKGQELSTDHVIPFAVCPELASTIANLELMPMKKNGQKSDRIGERQRALATKLFQSGLLSRDALARVLRRR